ncbi:MAG: phosphatidate cytidylyltransferase [Rhodospirillales bacterium]|nr:phosphatidate cytidylyltransferase [Rhodospirillales bacterium]
MSTRFDDLPERLLSTLVLAPVALGCLWAGGVAWTLLVALAGIGTAAEWARIVSFRPAALPGALLPVLVVAAGLATAVGFGQLALALLGIATAALATGGGPRTDTRLWLAGGLLYLGLAAVAAIWLRLGGTVGRGNALFVVAIVCASDTGAYLIGRFVGGPKLMPRISPSKTWAGAAGGVAFAIAAGLLVAKAFAAGVSLGGVGVSIVLGGASQGGDLVESAVKRRFGVKHSGTLIPGHGGLLDRLDGVLAAAPAAAILLLTLGPGAPLWR